MRDFTKEFAVIVTDDDGGEHCNPVKVMVRPDLSAVGEIEQALNGARECALWNGLRVAEVRIDWQSTAESALERIQDLTACIEGIADARSEADSGWAYYNADDVDSLLTQYGF